MKRQCLAVVAFALVIALPAFAQDGDGEEPPRELLESRGPRPEPLTSCSPGARADAEDVSLIALIANPSAYFGRRIRVVGYLHVGYHYAELYVDRGAFRAMVSSNAVSVDLGPDRFKVEKKMNDRVVVIVGTFGPPNPGAWSLGAGAVSNISSIAPWLSLAETQRALRQGRSIVPPGLACP